MRWIWIVIPLILVGIVGISESFAQELEIIASPKHQLESGILPDDIQCRDNRILVLRPNGNPACVSPQTAEKLMERGWAISLTNVEDKNPTNTIPVDLDSSNIIDANNQFAIDFYSQA